MTELSEKHISVLFDFVKSKYVRYTDVQYELVDHLASDIEYELSIDSSLSFEQALDKVYSKFPISGFSNYVSQNETQLNRFWMRKIFSQFSHFYGLTVILTLALITYVFHELILLFGTPIFVAIIIGSLLFNFLAVRSLRKVVKSIANSIGNNYLILVIFSGLTTASSMLPIYTGQVFFDLDSLYYISNGIHVKVLGFSFLFSITILWSGMIYFRFRKLIFTVLREKYAHLNLST